MLNKILGILINKLISLQIIFRAYFGIIYMTSFKKYSKSFKYLDNELLSEILFKRGSSEIGG